MLFLRLTIPVWSNCWGKTIAAALRVALSLADLPPFVEFLLALDLSLEVWCSLFSDIILQMQCERWPTFNPDRLWCNVLPGKRKIMIPKELMIQDGLQCWNPVSKYSLKAPVKAKIIPVIHEHSQTGAQIIILNHLIILLRKNRDH